LDPDRFKLLKKPLDAVADPMAAATGPSLRKPTAWPPK
jgi:hypothetical protein